MIRPVVIFLIRIYQKIIKPVLDQLLMSVFGFKSECRMSPSCSEYTIMSIKQHGVIKGIGLGIRRIGQCHSIH